MREISLEGAHVGVAKNIRERTLEVHIATSGTYLGTQRVETPRRTGPEVLAGVEIPPTLSLTYEQAEELVDELWHEGIRPRHPAENDRIVGLQARIEKLKDMLRLSLDTHD